MAVRRERHSPDVDRPRRGSDDAAKQAVREMVKHICDRTNLSRNQAYMLCSLAGNLRVTQLVDGNKGIHMLLPKSCL